MTEQYLSTDLDEIARERRVKNHNATFERAQQLRARLAVLQEARDLRLAEGRRLLAPWESAMKSMPWNLSAVARYETQRAQNAGALAGIEGEIEQVRRELNAPAPSKGTSTQWARPDWYKGPDREQIPDREVVVTSAR
jgi:hypothetical protein